MYLVLQKIVPCLPTEHVANAELEDVEREVSDDTVEPDDAGPAPATPFDLRKAPVRVNSYQGRNLSHKVGSHQSQHLKYETTNAALANDGLTN